MIKHVTKHELVSAFTKAMDQVYDQEPDVETAMLRQRLIMEEAKEVTQELLRPVINKVALTKELADLLYVVHGTAVAFGLPLDVAFNRVHDSNMSKLGPDGKPIYRDDGKVLKGPNYQPPKLDDLFDVSV
jgi:predicted HAD superfamily Cof-like phosphohydrolase